MRARWPRPPTSAPHPAGARVPFGVTKLGAALRLGGGRGGEDRRPGGGGGEGGAQRGGGGVRELAHGGGRGGGDGRQRRGRVSGRPGTGPPARRDATWRSCYRSPRP